MTPDFDTVMRVGGFLGTLLGFGWGLVRFLLGRIDRTAAKVSTDFANVHRRLDELRDQHVRREDYHRDLERVRDEMKMIRERVTEGLDGVRVEMRAELREVGARLDKMLLALSRADS